MFAFCILVRIVILQRTVKSYYLIRLMKIEGIQIVNFKLKAQLLNDNKTINKK